MARLIFTDMTAFTMGGTSYLADLRSFTEDPGGVFVDGGGFASGYDKEVLVKLGHIIPFEVQMSNLGTDATDGSDDDDDLEMTNLCVSAFSIDGSNRLADLRSFNFNVDSVTQEGSGLADLRQYPVRVKRRYTGSGTFLVNTGDSEIPLVQNQSDDGTLTNIYGAGSSFYVPMAFTITDPGASAVLNYSGDVSVRPRHVVGYEELQRVEFDWTNRGAPTTHTGAGIIATAMGASQPLIDLVWTVGNLTTDTSTLTAGAFINSLSISVQDAAVVSITGQLQIVTEPTFS